MRKKVLVLTIVGAVMLLVLAGGALAYFLAGSNQLDGAVHTAEMQDLVISPTPIFHEFEWAPGSTATQTVTVSNPAGNPELLIRLTGSLGEGGTAGLANALRVEIPDSGTCQAE
ncbi:MAG: hypothetical protein JXA57_16045 [Armatimonadetes bacterium]|nr:hypothetical protein [Armatimonadota bacterium]